MVDVVWGEKPTESAGALEEQQSLNTTNNMLHFRRMRVKVCWGWVLHDRQIKSILEILQMKQSTLIWIVLKPWLLQKSKIKV